MRVWIAAVLMIALVGGLFLFHPRPTVWADKNPCGTWCVHIHCPKGYESDAWNYWHDGLSGTEWAIDAVNGAQKSHCKITRDSLKFTWKIGGSK